MLRLSHHHASSEPVWLYVVLVLFTCSETSRRWSAGQTTLARVKVALPPATGYRLWNPARTLRTCQRMRLAQHRHALYKVGPRGAHSEGQTEICCPALELSLIHI